MSASDVATPQLVDFALPTDMEHLMNSQLNTASSCLHFLLYRIATTPANAGTRRECGSRWVIDPTPRSYRVEVGWGFIDAVLHCEDYMVILNLRERQYNDGTSYWGLEYLDIKRTRYRKLLSSDKHMMNYHYQLGQHHNDSEKYNEMISHEKYLPMMERLNNTFTIVGNWW